MLTVGDPAPDFHAKSHTGEMVSLASQRGKKVFLWFYPKADTPGCTAEGCSIRDLAAEFEMRNTVVFGVSFDDEADNAAFAKNHGFPFQLLCDEDHELGLAYGACKDPEAGYAERYSFLVDEDGHLAQAWLKVDPRKHAQEVLDFLDAQAAADADED